ncbi:MAG: extensin family protein [Deltaproteobacteria bacterium]|nr:extensin family protein [Deltaproteobacteria bacterium]
MRAPLLISVALAVLFLTGCPVPGTLDGEGTGSSGQAAGSSGVALASSEGGASATGPGGSSAAGASSGAESPDAGNEGGVDAGISVPNQGWIGGACASGGECAFTGGYCLTSAQGFPGGTCTQDCTQFCPDRPGANSVTFCVAPPSGVAATDGICVSRCDYSLFPATGCRDGYACQLLRRFNEPTTERYACLPGTATPRPTCYDELIAAGVPFEPTVLADDHPDGNASLTCHVQDPVRVNGPVRGIPFRYTSNAAATPMLMSCSLALALDRFAAVLVESSVHEVEHLGTYNCRVIAGTASLSQHGLGTAIDLAAFRFPDGRRWTVNDDFEIGTAPATPAGAWLWDLVNRLHTQRVFNIILTPNYNSAHRNHFHVDLTPGANYLGHPGLHPRVSDEMDRGYFVLAPNLHDD